MFHIDFCIDLFLSKTGLRFYKMDFLQNYTAGSDSEEEGEITKIQKSSSALPLVNLAPIVALGSKPTTIVAVYDEKDREIKTNPKYDELFRPDVSLLAQHQ